MNFVRSGDTNAALQRSISADRLQKYLLNAGSDLDAALNLYERNTLISEAFYTPLQGMEVCLRNRLDAAMTATYGERWLASGAAPLKDHASRWVDQAISGIGKPRAEVPHGKVVAELRFAFWVGLLGSTYDSTLWRKALHKAFGSEAPRKRRAIHGRFNALRRFRNRIAHHEPIFDRSPEQMYREAVEAVAWLCPETSAWIERRSRVLEAISN